MKKEKKQQKPWIAKGIKKSIRKKKTQTITERERQKYLNSKTNFCNPQLLKKKQPKKTNSITTNICLKMTRKTVEQ